MKKRLTPVYATFWALLSYVLFISYSDDPPNGHTGAPPTFATCTNCHSPGSGTGNVMITGLPISIAPNTTYPITVTVNRTNAVPQEGGFQMVVLDAANNNAGTLSMPGPSSAIQTEAGRTYFEHHPVLPFGANDFINYTVNWTAPPSGSGVITMYAAANLANSDGSSNGDNIVTTTAAGMMMGGGVITVNISSTNVTCFGGNNGSATANASGGGGGPYTYNWSNGATGQTANNLIAGTYTVTVTNAAAGTGTASVTITQPPLLTVSILNQININCFIPAGTATAQGAGGTGSFTYNWSNGETGATAVNLPAGINTVTVTDGNSCTAITTVNILSNTTPPIAEAGPPAQVDCANPATSLNGAGSSTGPNITYLWTTTNGTILSGATTLTPLVGAAGTYTLTVTNNSNGCTASDVTTVTANFSQPTSNAGPDTTINCAMPQVQLNGSASSTGPNFTYLWTTATGNIVSGANTHSPTVNAAGTYCLLVTNTTNGCTATDCANVSQNTVTPIANAGSAPPLTCAVTSVTLDGSASSAGPGLTFLWTTVNGNIVSGGNTTMPVVDAPGNYLLTVTNTNNGCTATATVQVTANTTPPTASAGPGMTLNCNNTVVVLNGSGSSQGGNFTYQWSGPGIQSGGNSTSPAVNAPGDYFITVTNTATGCTASDGTTVTQTPALTVSISNQANVDCNGNNNGSATAAGNGGAGTYSFAWSNGGAGTQVNNLPAGTYTVTLTDGDGCTSVTSAVITEPPALSAGASATGESSVGANDGTATADPSGGLPGYTYAWSNGETTSTITGLAAGNYTVTVTDDNGCTSAQTVTVSSFNCSGFGLSLTSTNPTCSGGMDGMITAGPTGGAMPYLFLWSNGETTATINGLGTGSFTVTVTDDNGCGATGNVSLAAPPALNLTVAQQTHVSCNGETDGSATVEAAGGTPGYTFLWSNNGQGASQNGLAAGAYIVTLTDANDCTASIQVTITQPPVLSGTVTATDETGVGALNGTATINVSGGAGPYTFEWDNGATAPSITNLPPGEYCATATDANGCTLSGCAMVGQFGCTGTDLTVSGENVTCFGGNDGIAMVSFAGFEPPFTIAWSSGGTGATTGGLTSGTYGVTVTGADGCTGTASIEITEPEALTVALLGLSNIECPGEATGTVSVNGQGGVPGYVFSWSNGSSNPTLTNLMTGSYEVTVNDASGCTASLLVEIEVGPDTLPPTAFATGLTVSLDLNGQATISAAMLDGGSFDNCGIDTAFLDVYDFDCENLGENFVVLTVADAAGNTSTDTAVVFVLDEIAPMIDCPPLISISGNVCEIEVDYLTPTAVDNCQDATVFLLAGLPSGALFPLGTTEITWGADDGNGNTAFCTFTVDVTSDIMAGTGFEQPTCLGSEDGTATAFPSGGVPPYSFEWDDPANQLTQTATGLAEGLYTVFVTDAEGCVTSTSVEVTGPTAVVIMLDDISNETGNGMDGSIHVTVSGGTGGTYTYEWFLNGSFFSNDEDLDGLAAGSYQLVATDQNGCTVTETFIVEKLTGTIDPTLDNRVTLRPNPVSHLLFVDFKLPQLAEVKMQILDLTGRPVQPEHRSMVVDETLSFDMSAMAPGIYLVRLVIHDMVAVKRIVVNR